ncbi:MAG: ABC transporter permease [Bacilli bacterium]|nr:ABC transporter permease [Bacilli bacterium]MDD4624328.1 ABC transporter permease [Bacilli bacterium]
MNNTIKVFLFEFKNKFKEKTIMISSIIILLLIFIATFIPSIINNNKKTEEEIIKEQIEEMENVGYIINDKDIESFLINDKSELKLAKKYSNESVLINDIESKDIKIGFVIINETNYKIIRFGSEFAFSEVYDYGIKDNLTIYAKNKFYKEHNIDPMLVSNAEKIEISSTIQDIGKSAENNFFIAYIGTFIIYFIIILFGVSVSTTIAREKNDRTMELLITNTSSTSLIVGKVLASLIFSIGQIIAMLLIGYIGILLNKASYPPNFLNILVQNISPSLIIIFLLFSFFGCLMYFFVYASLGSLVSRVEDVNNAIGPIQLIFITSFMISMISMNTPNSSLLTISSFIPFTSPMAMFVRYSMTLVPLIDVIISLILLIITSVLLAYLSIKIYRQATLNYGNKLSLIKVLKNIK